MSALGQIISAAVIVIVTVFVGLTVEWSLRSRGVKRKHRSTIKYRHHR